MRLQRYLALAGVASRRRSEELMAAGRVSVNGKIVDKLGASVDPERDVVFVDGERIETEEKVYILLNKPRGYLSSVTDPRGRPTVTDLTVGLPARLYPVGRLDKDTEGVLLMTNDGDLCHRLTHPRFGVDKKYRVEVKGKPSRQALDRLRRGVRIDAGKTSPAGVRLLRYQAGRSTLEITVHEGRKRQIKKMCETIRHPVTRLERIEFGGIRLGGLKRGEYRILSDSEVSILRKKAGGGPE